MEFKGTRTWEYVDHWADKLPDKEVMVFGDRRVSWDAYRQDTDAFAKGLIDAGVEKGDRVAMIAMACPEFLVSFMGANKAGAIWLGLSPKFKAHEFQYMIEDCRPKVLITLREYMGDDLADTLKELDLSSIEKILVIGEPIEGSESFDGFIDQGKRLGDDALTKRASTTDADDTALLMYTSGSTGKPKGVEQTHRAIITSADIQNRYFGAEQEMRALMHFPINHVAADVEIGFATLYAGGTLVMIDHFDPMKTLEVVEREKISLLGQVPAMYLMEMGLPKFRETDFSSVRTWAWGGASAPKDMLKGLMAMANQSGARLVTGYGSTELCGFVTFSDPDDDLETLTTRAGRCPKPYEIKIVDDDGATCPNGQTGEVCVRGDVVMKGYWNKPDVTASVIDADGWYHSSDLGYLDETGNLCLCGRKSEMFKTGGENVFPREVEDVIEKHPAVLFAAVIGVPDPKFQEVGRAYIMAAPGQQVTDDELRALCKEHLANFKVPKHFDIRPALPLLPNGKVNKMALKAELAELST